MHTFHFDDQYHTHQSYGYSIAPGGQEIVGDQEAFLSKKGWSQLLLNACILHDVVAHPLWGIAALQSMFCQACHNRERGPRISGT